MTAAGRAAWSALTTGLVFLGGSVVTCVYLRFGWHPTDPFALVGAFVLGGFGGLFAAAAVADGVARYDRALGLDRNVDRDDVLRIARAVGVAEDGVR